MTWIILLLVRIIPDCTWIGKKCHDLHHVCRHHHRRHRRHRLLLLRLRRRHRGHAWCSRLARRSPRLKPAGRVSIGSLIDGTPLYAENVRQIFPVAPGYVACSKIFCFGAGFGSVALAHECTKHQIHCVCRETGKSFAKGRGTMKRLNLAFVSIIVSLSLSLSLSLSSPLSLSPTLLSLSLSLSPLCSQAFSGFPYEFLTEKMMKDGGGVQAGRAGEGGILVPAPQVLRVWEQRSREPLRQVREARVPVLGRQQDLPRVARPGVRPATNTHGRARTRGGAPRADERKDARALV